MKKFISYFLLFLAILFLLCSILGYKIRIKTDKIYWEIYNKTILDISK